MNSRERLAFTLAHRQPDRPPVDLGATSATGMAVSTMALFREHLGLKKKTIKAFEPLQMLGEVDEDLHQLVGGDVVGLWSRSTWFGYRNEDFKSWTMPDGQEVLVGRGFEVSRDDAGNILLHPQGDRNAQPSAKMPSSGAFFDLIARQEAYDEDDLDGRRDFADQFALIPDDELQYLETESRRLFHQTDYGIIGQLPGMGLGSLGHIPGPALKRTPGIRAAEDWYMAHSLYPDYIHEIFSLQVEVALKNLERYRQAVGDRIQVIWISGTDFGTQKAEMMSPEMWRRLYKPYYQKVNDWVHQNTSWKTFYHSCGSIVNLIDDFIECGVDVLNPVQCSAAGMDPQTLKNRFGSRIVFWGGGIDTQHTLPFGTPEEVASQAKERIRIFAPGGGFVYTTIHNAVASVPPANLKAFYNAFKSEYGLPLIP